MADRLLELITSGEYQVGQRMPTERELMARFEVGRNTVREATRFLVALGVCDVRPGRGALVIAPHGATALGGRLRGVVLADSSIDDLYEFRMLLETEAAAKAAERATEEDKAAIVQALDAYDAAATTGVDAFRRDVEFHRVIVAASGNTAYGAALDAVADRLTDVRRETDAVPGALPEAAAEHRAIAHYILEGNHEAARAAMTMHMNTARRTLAKARELRAASARSGDDSVPASGGRAPAKSG